MEKRVIISVILLFVFSSKSLAQKMIVKDSDLNVLMEVNDEGTKGSITLSKFAAGTGPTTPTDKLYNVDGALYWNGSELGMAGSAGGWTDGGTSVYLSTSSDKVGIGTSSPDEKLQVEGRIFNKGNTVNDGITIGNSQSNDESVHLTWQNNQGLSIHSWGRNFGDQLFIDGNSSNIGIGDTSPTHKLDVAGKIAVNDTQVVYLPNQTDFTGTLYLGDGGGSLSHTDFTSEGKYNTAVGIDALNANTTGLGNTASGYDALYSNTEGEYNTASGYDALYSNTTGNYNVGIGTNANYYNDEGSSNTIVGYHAGFGTSFHTKTGNVFIGYQAGYSADEGANYNICIGYMAGYGETGSNKLYIENSNITTPLIGGDFSTNRVGINTKSPGTAFAVVGLTGTSSYANVRVNPAGDFYYETSSRRYKEDIRDLEDDFHKILDVEPRSFTDKTSGQREIGYIAEEFEEKGLKDLVIYNDKNIPDGLRYDRISLYLVEVVKEQQKKIAELEERIIEMQE